MTLHILGDSHAQTFQGAKDVVVHWLGAVTAFNLWKKNLIIQEILKDIPKTDRIFFCLGEIDMRIHIYKAMKETSIMPPGFYTDITLYNYVRYVRTLQFDHDVSIMAIPPQGYQDNYFGYEHYADRDLRNQFTVGSYITFYSLCEGSKIPFIDIWEEDWENLCNSTEDCCPMFPEDFFQEDKCHIKPEIAIDRLEKYLGR